MSKPITGKTKTGLSNTKRSITITIEEGYCLVFNLKRNIEKSSQDTGKIHLHKDNMTGITDRPIEIEMKDRNMMIGNMDILQEIEDKDSHTPIDSIGTDSPIEGIIEINTIVGEETTEIEKESWLESTDTELLHIYNK